MSLEGRIAGTQVNFLVDTGASCTLISEKIFKKLSKSAKFQLGVLADRKFQQADGTPLRVLGKLNVKIQLGTVVVQHEVIVASISDEGIIGYDFLKKHSCHIDIENDEFHLKGRKVSCSKPEEENYCEKLKKSQEDYTKKIEDKEENSKYFQGVLKITEEVHLIPENSKHFQGVLKIKEKVHLMPASEKLAEENPQVDPEVIRTTEFAEPMNKVDEKCNLDVATVLLEPNVKQMIDDTCKSSLGPSDEIEKKENQNDITTELSEHSTEELQKKQMEDPGSSNQLLLVVPRKLRQKVLHELHDISGHLGEKKTYRKLSKRFFWFKMRDAVLLFVRKCVTCSKSKKNRKKSKISTSEIPDGFPVNCNSLCYRLIWTLSRKQQKQQKHSKMKIS